MRWISHTDKNMKTNILRIIVICVFFTWNVSLKIKAADSKTIPITKILSGQIPVVIRDNLMMTNVSLVSAATGKSTIFDYLLMVPECRDHNEIQFIFSDNPLKNWAVLNHSKPAESFLTWQDKSYVCISKLPDTGIFERISTFGCGFISTWQADHFINLKDYEKWKNSSTNSDEVEVTLTSVTTKSEGIAVTATNKLGEGLKFIKSKAGWLAYNGTNEIRRFTISPIDWNILETRGYWPAYFTNTLMFKTATGASVTRDVSLKPKQLGGLWTYQLYETTNVENKLSQPVWESIVAPFDRFGHFTLVENGKGDGYYLCWTDLRGRLCLSAITNSWPDAKYVEDPNVGPFSYLKDDPFMRGRVDHIIDLRQFADGERFFKDGGGVASAKQENNVLTLTVTNAAGSKFTFSNQDGQWHAYSFWGEINRVKK